jgi:hypothetical protein
VTKTLLKVGSILILAALASLLLVSVTVATATVPNTGVPFSPAQANSLDDETFLTIIFATFGALVGAAILTTLAYLLRRALGIDWHRSTGEGVHNAHAHSPQPSHEEVAAGIHEAAVGETAEEAGGQP